MDRLSNLKETNKSKTDQRPLIQSVEYAGDYFLYITLTDGSARMVDLKPFLKSSIIYKPFLKISKFKKFKFTPLTIEWPGNILDRHITHLIK